MNRATRILARHGVVLRRGIRLGAAAAERRTARNPRPANPGPIPQARRRRAPRPRAPAARRRERPSGATAAPAALRRPHGRRRPSRFPGPGAPRPRGPRNGSKSAAKNDRLELGTATVTGDREQPKVMYIVPWKRSDIGDLAGKPMNSLVDEILAPVDRDVFKREVVYYGAVQAEASQNGAPPKPSQQVEK